MRRSICVSEPNSSLAGDVDTWSFTYTTATTLPKGAKLKFDLASDGRAIDWEIPETSLRKDENVIYALTKAKKPIPMKEVEKNTSYVPDFELTLPQALPAGETITIVLGAGPKIKGKTRQTKGSQSQAFSQRRKPFYLFVDPSGKGKYNDEPELFMMDIRGNALQHIEVLVPSFVVRNRRFDAVIRFEDEFGNLTNNAPEDTLIEVTHEHLRENLNWKLFLPETGYITLPNLYFNDPGMYTMRLKNLNTDEIYYSAPIRCIPEHDVELLWGTLHGESERVDSLLKMEQCLRHYRDDLSQKFYASSPFENAEETTADAWKQSLNQLNEFDEEERFSTFTGFQWQGKAKTEGIRLFIYGKDNKSIMRSSDTKCNSLKKIYQLFSPKELISIPTFTMGKGFEYNFANYNPEFERVVEIYNAWGSSETSGKKGNPCPITKKGKKGIAESSEGEIQKALSNNCRFGFVAGGLDDRGIYANLYESGQTQYPPGLTAILAKTHNRQGILDALYNRSCYATTGEKMIVGIDIIGAKMGQELSTADKPGLQINRHISGYAAGTCNISTVEIIRNGQVLTTLKGEDYHIDFEYDDHTPLDKIAIKNKGQTPFVYYYLRVTQEDGNIAWSSPIWIDCLPKKKK